ACRSLSIASACISQVQINRGQRTMLAPLKLKIWSEASRQRRKPQRTTRLREEREVAQENDWQEKGTRAPGSGLGNQPAPSVPSPASLPLFLLPASSVRSVISSTLQDLL